MSSPISSASEYNSALDETINSSLSPEKLNLSLTESDIENVNLSQEWSDLLKSPPKVKHQDPRQSTQLLLDSMKNNNFVSGNQSNENATLKSPSKSLNNETMDSTLSTISLDISGTGSLDGSSTLSLMSSSGEASALVSDEEVNTTAGGVSSASVTAPKPSQLNVSLVSGAVTLDDESPTTKDSKDTTHNVSQLPADDEQSMTEPGHSQSQKDSFKIYSTLEEFDRNLPDTVTLLTTPEGSKVYLVGTAHFSEGSQNDVSLVMRNVRPDCVMLELCPSRVDILKMEEKTLLAESKDINLAKIQNIVKRDGAINGLFYILFLNMSAKVTEKLGMAPGGEFRRAVSEAGRLPKCLIFLGDRPINITLQRALRALSLWQTLKLIPKLLLTEDISAEDVEQCKQKDLLDDVMLEMAGEFPAFTRVFVEERDLYLCHSLQIAAQPLELPDGSRKPVNVVGVVGIGHAAGIIKHWGKVESSYIGSIITIPPVSFSHRAAKFVLKYGTLGLCAYGVFKFMRPRLHRWL